MRDSQREHELDAVLADIRSGHDIVPFMEQMLPVADIRLAIMPEDMMNLLMGSADFRPLAPGAPPTWFQVLGSGNQVAELVVYRARADDRHYVLAPA